MVKRFVVLFILACSVENVSVAQPPSAPFIDVVDTDAVAADLFARDFKADPSYSGLNLHSPKGSTSPTAGLRFGSRSTKTGDGSSPGRVVLDSLVVWGWIVNTLLT
jgi:hypothetical protein